MEYPWRSRPPLGNLCPVCSHSHFPFCPPNPPQYFRSPPPPPDQFFRYPSPPPQQSCDPFVVDHQGAPTINPCPPPAPAQIPPRPWSVNPNFRKDYYGNSNSGLDYDNNFQIGVKRLRFNHANDGYMSLLAEDERRLKLIRDHGAASETLDRKYDGGYGFSNNSFRPSDFGDKGSLGDRFQGVEGGYTRETNSHMKQNYIENNKNVELGRAFHYQNESNVSWNYENNIPGVHGCNNFKRSRGNDEIPAYNDATYQEQRWNFSAESREFNNQFLQSHATQHHRMEPESAYCSLSNQCDYVLPPQDPPGFKAQPPLPSSPPPPLPVEQPRFPFSESIVSSSASGTGFLFPIAVDSASSFPSGYTMVSEATTSVSSQFTKVNENSSGYHSEEMLTAKISSTQTFNGKIEDFTSRNHLLNKPKVVDASHILKHPHRANRPDHVVIILRGLPGSGKSYLAKILRDIEVENGGTAPRIHSMDDYFMAEVEESEGLRSSGSVRGKKPVTKKVMEYCYEPEMEEAYRSSMLKAFKKTLDEGTFPFVIVDDRNLQVADFAQFWATAKRSGYEVYLLEATYKDPVGCAARNVHGFTQSDIHKMANQWEEAPSLYMKIDMKSLLHGDDLEENGIEEVDMDTDDGNYIGDPSCLEDTNIQKVPRPYEGDLSGHGSSADEKRWHGAEERVVEVVKELGKSKWSNDLDGEDVDKAEATRGNSSALSSLVKSYRERGKSVRWADQIGRIGFSISAGKASNVSLVIGPGSGYNLKSNPLPEEEKLTQRYTGESRRRNIFQEQLRAEHESFRAVFDKKKHRISGLDADEG